MRKIFLAVAVLGVCGCAAPETFQQQAANNCQSVGIGEKDPQFETCVFAFRRAYLEGRLERSFHDLNTSTEEARTVRRSVERQ